MLLEEQETIINFNRAEEGATIFTSDRTMMTKLDKLVAASEHYSLVREETLKGEVCGKLYAVDDKGLVSLRSKKVSRDMTEEQRRELGERLKNGRNRKS